MGQSVVYRTTNSGLNWSPTYSYYSPNYLEDVKWVHGTSTIYLSNVTDRVKRSTNGGITWSNMNPIFYYPPLTGIDAVKINSTTIYALGFIGKTTEYEPQVYKLIDTLHIIGIENLGSLIPDKFYLYQNYPNPFNPETTIRIDLSKQGILTIDVYDILGRLITSLVNRELKSAGSYQVKFSGENYPSGMYFYKVTCGDFTETRKMILLK